MATVTPLKQEPKIIDADALKKNKRLVILALEDYFDDANKRYRDGKSDHGVAEELSLAPAFVSAVREEFFGKLSQPKEITEVQEMLHQLTVEFGARVNQLETTISTLSKKHGWS